MRRDTMPRFHFESAGRSEPGNVRRRNEDACLASDELGLWAVADGMGGHSDGDQASKAAVSALAALPPAATAAEMIAEVREALQRVNWGLCNQAGTDEVVGTTIVALAARGGRFNVAWAGDSRLYLLRDGKLRQITRDHSHVQELVDKGALSPEEARRHPQANVLTRALGAELALDLDEASDAVHDRDVFLLCSDGLGKDVEEAEIAQLLDPDAPARRLADQLVDLALARSGVDNITVVVVRAGRLAQD